MLDDLEGFLGRWREPLESVPGALDPLAQRRLTQRVLSGTTRQAAAGRDVGWRGDAAIVLRFVSDRLGASPALRVAAAILLLQVLALPVLAWIVWREPIRERFFRARFEERRVQEVLPAVPETPLDELVLEPPPEELRPARIAPQPGALEIQRNLRTASRSLRTSTWPQPQGADAWEQSTTLRLLHARARLAQQPDGALDPLDEELLVHRTGADGIERALRAELLLDVLALTGRAPDGLSAAVAALGSDARDPGEVRHLEALAVERARACGQSDARAWSRLGEVGAVPGSRNADPLDAPWRAALQAALASDPGQRQALADEALARWLEGAERPR
jgi:hypothetical protein